MYNRYQIEKLRRQEIKEIESRGEIVGEEMLDDVALVERWHHYTNIEASDLLLERLKKYHPEMS
jgi:hypothetical protein